MTTPRKGATAEEKIVALGRLIEEQSRKIDALTAELDRRFNANAVDVADAKRDAGHADRTARRALDLIVEVSKQISEGEGGEEEPRKLPANLLMPEDVDELLTMLRELRTWLRTVYMRYGGNDDDPDRPTLSGCWAWHPGAVTELWTLYRMWLAAYQGPKASDQAVADWHDRYRPGTVRRVNAALRGCWLEKHTDRMAYKPPAVRGDELLHELATWMVEGGFGEASPPAPTPGMLAVRTA